MQGPTTSALKSLISAPYIPALNLQKITGLSLTNFTLAFIQDSGSNPLKEIHFDLTLISFQVQKHINARMLVFVCLFVFNLFNVGVIIYKA